MNYLSASSPALNFDFVLSIILAKKALFCRLGVLLLLDSMRLGLLQWNFSLQKCKIITESYEEK